MGFWYTRKPGRYNIILQGLHDSIIRDFKNSENEKKAKELENILREVKKEAREIDNLSDTDRVTSRIKGQYYDLIALANQILRQGRKTGMQARKLFHRAHGSVKNITDSNGKRISDDIFEEEFAAFISAVEASATDFIGVSDMDIHLFGTSSQTTGAMKLAKQKGYEEGITKHLEKMVQEIKKDYEVQDFEVFRKGKIDVSGINAQLIISKNVHANMQRLAALLQGANFTVKNYKSKRYSKKLEQKYQVSPGQMKIKLGDTELFKAVTGVLAEVGADYDPQFRFFYRGANTIVLNSHGFSGLAQEHWGHIKIIYELRGSGLMDSNGNLTKADYIIWNDPDTDNIAVADTGTLLMNIIQKRNVGIFGDVSITGKQIMDQGY